MPDLLTGLSHPYLQHALIGGTIVAIFGAAIGYFVILRGATFATHALSQIGFAGAAGAVLVGIEPIVGLVAFSLGGALLLTFAERRRSSDVLTALVLVAALGTGALFLALARDYASNVFSLLFGTVVGIDATAVVVTALAALTGLALLGAIARPLLFAIVAREAAVVAGVRVRLLDAAFYAIVALSSAVAVPVVGALLVFSLTIGPAAAATRLSTNPARAVALAALLGVAAVLGGTALAYETDWPLGFFVASIALLEYLASRGYERFAGTRRPAIARAVRSERAPST